MSEKERWDQEGPQCTPPRNPQERPAGRNAGVQDKRVETVYKFSVLNNLYWGQKFIFKEKSK